MTNEQIYHWMLKNVQEIHKQPDGSFKLAYSVGSQMLFVTAPTIKDCVRKANNASNI